MTSPRLDATEPKQPTAPAGYPSTPIGPVDDIFFNPHHRDTTDYTTVDLILAIDSALIRDRWLQSFLLTPG